MRLALRGCRGVRGERRLTFEVLLTFAVTAGLGYGTFLLVRWRPVFVRPVCLACGAGVARTGAGVGTRANGFGKRVPTRWVAYRCPACAAEFVRPDGKGLVPRAAWDAAPVPGARIVD